MSPDTIVYALVAIAVLGGVALSLMFAANSNSRSRRLEMTWEMSRPAKLAAEVADLVGAVEANKRATRAELGKIWQKFSKLEFTEPEGDPEQAIANLASQVEPVCENFIVAQNPANPGWRDARECECAYCLRVRASRAAEKATILAKRGIRAKGNGSE